MSIRSVVIVPVDGSRETGRIMDFAVSLARARAATVHAVEVVRRNRDAPRPTALPPSGEQDSVRVRHVMLRGTPERVIPAYAQLYPGSVIVVASHYGSSWFWRTSAVAADLSRTSPVPVFVIPSRGNAEARVSWNRIIAAVDFTVASTIALRTAADLSTRHGAQLTVVHAMNPVPWMVFSGGDARRVVQRLPLDAKAIAERLRREATELGLDTVEPVVVTGDPYRGIVETAAERNAGVIVMGVAPRHWLDQMMFGSTLRAVLRRATSPVLVLPVVAGAHDVTDLRHVVEASEPRVFAEHRDRHAA